jgi:outer membrane lipoprotein SlyB
MMMSRSTVSNALVAVAALLVLSGTLLAQTRVNYGRITAVSLITEQNRDAQASGAVLGGMLGLATSAASSSSGAAAALRGVGGAIAGQQIGRVSGQRQAFKYTILLGGDSTITMVTDEAGMRVGDCVAVERGTFNNLRLVDDARCEPPAQTPPAADVSQADVCIQAKDRLFDAKTDAEFERAYRTVRLLCVD